MEGSWRHAECGTSLQPDRMNTPSVCPAINAGSHDSQQNTIAKKHHLYSGRVLTLL
jgi:hypothetical protein